MLPARQVIDRQVTITSDMGLSGASNTIFELAAGVTSRVLSITAPSYLDGITIQKSPGGGVMIALPGNSYNSTTCGLRNCIIQSNSVVSENGAGVYVDPGWGSASLY